MPRSIDDIQREINTLETSYHVQLARMEEQLRDVMLDRLQTLQALEKRGRFLAAAGLSVEILNAALRDGALHEEDNYE